MKMQKIKFRAWDNLEKKMYYCIIVGKKMISPFVYMQYTGLKDKNGKELWESDIIENEHGERWLIVWEGTGFRVALRGNKEAIYAPNEYWFNSCKKIGNIHENPELLEESCWDYTQRRRDDE